HGHGTRPPWMRTKQRRRGVNNANHSLIDERVANYSCADRFFGGLPTVVVATGSAGGSARRNAVPDNRRAGSVWSPISGGSTHDSARDASRARVPASNNGCAATEPDAGH